MRIKSLILIVNLIIQISLLQAQDYYYSAPIGEVNYDDDVISAITKKYNKLVRPVSTLNMTVRLSMRQIISIEEKSQTMTSSFYLISQWKDGRLKWDSTNSTFGYLSQILIPATSIWTPDLFVINTASSTGFISISSSNLAVVNSEGNVFLILGVTNLQTRCKMNIYYFPFDKQNCSIVIGSWQHDKGRINFDSDTSKLDLSGYIPHPVWTLKSVTVNTIIGSDRFTSLKDLQSNDIAYYFYIVRGGSYYMANLIVCFILNVVSLFAFFMPYAQQIALCMTAFLTFAVQSLNISNFLPVQSLYVPMITVYFIFSILLTFVALLWFWIMNYYTGKPLPFILYHAGLFSKNALFWIYPMPSTTPMVVKKAEETENQVIKMDLNQPVSSGIINSCNLCGMCDKCKDKKEKEDKKKKEKDANDTILQALNYMMFYLLMFCIVCILSIIWIVNAIS